MSTELKPLSQQVVVITGASSGIGAATAISNLYYPDNSHSLGNAATRMGFQLLWDGLTNELKEFWPDFRDWRRRRKARTP